MSDRNEAGEGSPASGRVLRIHGRSDDHGWQLSADRPALLTGPEGYEVLEGVVGFRFDDLEIRLSEDGREVRVPVEETAVAPSLAEAGGDVEGLVPDQFGDLGELVDLDLFHHLQERVPQLLDGSDVQILVEGLPPGLEYDPVAMRMHGTFTSDVELDAGYGVRVTILVGGEVLARTRFLWVVRDRAAAVPRARDDVAVIPPARVDDGTGSAVLFALASAGALLGMPAALGAAARVRTPAEVTEAARGPVAFEAYVPESEAAFAVPNSASPASAAALSALRAFRGSDRDDSSERDTYSAGQRSGVTSPREAAPPASETASSSASEEADASVPATPIEEAPVDEGGVTGTEAPPNASPLITPLPAITTIEDNATSALNVLAQAFDPDGDPMSVISARANEGTVSIGPDGSLVYTPRADYFGDDIVTYQISDGRGGISQGTIPIEVVGINDFPSIGTLPGRVTDEDVPIARIAVLDQASDPDGDPLSVTGVVAAHGQVSVDGDGAIFYRPDPDYFGPDTILYSVEDGNGGIANGTIAIDVRPVNDAPRAGTVPDAAGQEDALLSGIDVVSFADDVEGDLVSVDTTRPLDALHGTVDVAPDGTLSYQPDPNFSGRDTITYTLSDGRGGFSTATFDVVVAPVNDDPQAGSPPPLRVTEDTTATDIDVVSFASDVDGDPVTLASASAVNGTVAIQPDGRLAYTPDPDFAGMDTITYAIEDGRGGTATGHLAVTVDGVPDAPLLADTSSGGPEDASIEATIWTVRNDPATQSLTDSDGDIDFSTFTFEGAGPGQSLTVAGVGTFSLVTPAGRPDERAVRFDPVQDFSGTYTVRYSVEDATGLASRTASHTFTLAEVNDAPVALADAGRTNEDDAVVLNLAANDFDVDGDALSIARVFGGLGTVSVLSATSVEYVPPADFDGVDTFSYEIADGRGGTATGTVSVRVDPINDAPIAYADAAATLEDTNVAFDVLGNDTDVDGDTLRLVSATSDVGTVIVTPGGTVTFTPPADFNGTASIAYTITDDNGGTASGTASVRVDPVNDAPLAADDVGATNEDQTITFDPRANDTDADGDALTIVDARVPSGNGTVAFTGTTITYTPNPDFNGSDIVVYTVEDPSGERSTANVDISVAPVNDDPQAGTAGTRSTSEDTPLAGIDVLSFASDIDGDAVALEQGTAGAVNGTVTTNPDGTLDYVPDADFDGLDTITYFVVDGQGGRDSGSVVVNVGGVNDAPVAGDDTATTVEDDAVTFDPRPNDTDADGDALTIVNARALSPNGSVAFTGTTITYTPASNFNGTDQVEYTIDDGQGGQATAIVDITVAAVNDAPVAVDDTASVAEDGSTTIDVLANDFDVDGNALRVTGASASNGTVSVLADNRIVYVPDPDFDGTDTILYSITDDQGGTANGSVVVATVPGDDAPLANADTASGLEDTAIVVDVLANDTDPDTGDSFDPASIQIVGTASPGDSLATAQGTWTVDTVAGRLVFTPLPDFEGPVDSIEYSVADASGLRSNAATVSLTVTPVDDVPTVTLRTASVEIEAARWMHNRSDAPRAGEIADATTILAVGDELVGAGLAIVPSDGVLRVGDANETDFASAASAADYVEYSFTAGEDATLTSIGYTTYSYGGDFTVSAVVSSDGFASSATLVSDHVNVRAGPGDIDLGDGSFMRQVTLDVPDQGLAAGTTYAVRLFFHDVSGDGGAYGPGDLVFDDFRLSSVSATPNAGVVFVEGGEGGTGPVAFAPHAAIADVENRIERIEIDVAGLADVASEAILVATDTGSVLLGLGADGVRDVRIGGVDLRLSLTTGAPARIELTHQIPGTTLSGAQAETALQALSYDNATLAATEGLRTFTIQVIDEGGNTSLAVDAVVSVVADNDAPVAGVPAATVVNEDTALLGIDVVAAAFDPEGDAISLDASSPPFALNGTVTIDGGRLDYVPDADFNGTDTITYTLVDARGATTTATLGVTVNPVNDAPETADDSATGTNTAPIDVLVLANDADVDDAIDPSTLRLAGTANPGDPVVQAGQGTWTVDLATGTVTFTPLVTFSGTATIDYTVRDVSGDASTPATVSVAVVDGNVAPTAIGSDDFRSTALNTDGGDGLLFVADDGSALFGNRSRLTYEVEFALEGIVDNVPLASYNTNATDGIADAFSIMLAPSGPGGDYRIGIAIEGAFVSATAFDAVALADGAFHTLSVTWDNAAGDWQLFVDGALVDAGTGLAAGVQIAPGGTFAVGQELDVSGVDGDLDEVFRGQMRDVRLFDDVRTAGEVAAAAGTGVTPTEPGLVANWLFGDAESGAVIDVVSANDLSPTQVPGFTASVPEDAASIREDAGTGAVVATLTTTDPNAANTFTYTIQDDPSGFFEIVGDEIRLRSGAALDHEIAATHDLLVRSTDQGGLFVEETVTVYVENLNEAPTDISRSAFSTAVSFNEDGGDAGHYEVLDTGTFFAGTSDFTLEVAFATADTSVASHTLFSLNDGVNDAINLAIVDPGTTPRIYFEVGNQWTTLAGFDASALLDGAMHTLSVSFESASGTWQVYVDGTALGGGAGLGAGHVIPANGHLSVGHELDSDPPLYDATERFGGQIGLVRFYDDVRSSSEVAGLAATYDETGDPNLLAEWRFDGENANLVVNAASPGTLDLPFSNVTEPGFVATVPSAVLTVADDVASGSVAAVLSTQDPDAGDTHTYSIVSDPSGAFAIVGDELRVADPSALDYDVQPSVTLRVRTTDAAGAFVEEDIAIRVTNGTGAFLAAPAASYGTPNADAITLDDFGRYAYGQGADDAIAGGAGNDRLFGQDGADDISGGAGDDVLVGDRSHLASDAVGPQTVLNGSGTFVQSAPVVAALDDGNMLAVWFDHGFSGSIATLKGRVVGADGTGVGADFAIGTASVARDDGVDMPTVTATRLSDGRVAVGWQSEQGEGVDGDRSASLLSIVDPDLAIAGPQQVLNTFTVDDQSAPIVVALGDGTALAVWIDDAPSDSTDALVRGRFLDADGAPSGADFQIGTTPVEGANGQKVRPLDVAVMGDGNVLVAWSTQDGLDVDSDKSAVVAAVVDVATRAAGTEFIVNVNGSSNQSGPVLAELTDGRILATWIDTADKDGDAATLVQARFLDADGLPDGAQFQISNIPVEGNGGFDMPALAVARTASGGAVVSFLANDGENVDGDGSAVVAAMVDSTGTVTSTQVINDVTAGDQSAPVVVALHDGRFFFAWYDDANGDNNATSVVRATFMESDGTIPDPSFQLGTAAVEGDNGGELPPLTAALTANGDVLVAWQSENTSNVDGDEAAVASVLVATRTLGGNDILDGGDGNDSAVYSGNQADYEVMDNADGSYSVRDLRPGSPDGTDTLRQIETLVFSDATVAIGAVAVASPIAFDLDRSGAIDVTGETTARDKSGIVTTGALVSFDLDGDGTDDTIDWLTASRDALLVDDRDGRAAEDMNGTRLFGDENGRFRDGYEKLAGLDQDRSGALEGTELRGLKLWFDDGDADVEDGELFTLDDFGIVSVSVETNEAYDAEGRALVRSSAQTRDGETIMTEDVWFSVIEAEARRPRLHDDEDAHSSEDAL